MKEILHQLFITEQKSASQVGQLLGLTVNQVYSQLSKYNIRKARPKKTFWRNLDFNNLSPYDVYMLGFLWADGYLTNGGYILACQIVSNDFIELESIFNTVGSWGIYHTKPCTKKGVVRQARTTLSISDKKLCDMLVSYQFDQKSQVSPTALLSAIPYDLQYLFFRGLFDGDGCFYVKNSTYQFAVGGTYSQDWSHIENLFDGLGIINYKINRKVSTKGHKSSIIRITSFNNVKKLSHYIYQNRLDLLLPRKYEKVQHVLEVGYKRESCRNMNYGEAIYNSTSRS